MRSTAKCLHFIRYELRKSRRLRILRFARRCTSLRSLSWIGRNGKGEWQISGSGSSAKVHFYPFHQMEDTASDLLTLECGADVEETLVARRMSSFGSLKDTSNIEVSTLAYLAEAFQSDEDLPARQDHQPLQPRKRSNTVEGAIMGEMSVVRRRSNTLSSQVFAESYPDIQPATVCKAPVLTQLRKPSGNIWRVEQQQQSNCCIGAKLPSPLSVITKGAGLVLQNKVSGRATTRLRGPDDGFSGPTVIIGQGRPASRRSSKKKKKKPALSSPTSTKTDLPALPGLPKSKKKSTPPQQAGPQIKKSCVPCASGPGRVPQLTFYLPTANKAPK